MAELNETIHQPVRLRIMAALVTLEPGNEVDFTYLRDLLRGHRRQPGRPPAQTGRGRLHRRQQDLRRTQAAHLRLRHRRGAQGLPGACGGTGIDLEKQVRQDMDTIVQVEGLRKIYGTTVAVDEVSFEVAKARSSGWSARTGPARPPPSNAWKACANRTRGRCASWAWTRSATARPCASAPGCSCSSPTCRTG